MLIKNKYNFFENHPYLTGAFLFAFLFIPRFRRWVSRNASRLSSQKLKTIDLDTLSAEEAKKTVVYYRITYEDFILATADDHIKHTHSKNGPPRKYYLIKFDPTTNERVKILVSPEHSLKKIGENWYIIDENLGSGSYGTVKTISAIPKTDNYYRTGDLSPIEFTKKAVHVKISEALLECALAHAANSPVLQYDLSPTHEDYKNLNYFLQIARIIKIPITNRTEQDKQLLTQFEQKYSKTKGDKIEIILPYIKGPNFSDETTDPQFGLSLYDGLETFLIYIEMINRLSRLGIFHGDSRDNNIIVETKPGQPLRLKLIDFGRATYHHPGTEIDADFFRKESKFLFYNKQAIEECYEFAVDETRAKFLNIFGIKFCGHIFVEKFKIELHKHFVTIQLPSSSF